MKLTELENKKWKKAQAFVLNQLKRKYGLDQYKSYLVIFNKISKEIEVVKKEGF